MRLPADGALARMRRGADALSVTDRVLALVAALCGAALLVSLARQGFRDLGTQSYAALAQAFLDGRLDVAACPEKDCAVFGGRTYIIFPPFPALVALPFVLLFGPGFGGFVPLATALAAASLGLWQRILATLGTAPREQAWLLMALAFASPLYGVTYASGSVWFFAQCVGFLLATLALWAAICRRSLALAAAFLGCAFLCRQMYILLFPALMAVGLAAEPAWFRPSRRSLLRLVAAVAVLGGFVGAYCLYNWARFGAPLETGYRFLSNDPQTGTYMDARIAELGLFSRRYALQNVLYLFVQGFHAEFGGAYFRHIQGLDALGTSLLVASPWVVLAAYMKFDRVAVVLLGAIGVVAGLTLFYHSNGAYQVNMQRYTLDWLPLLLVLMARPPHPAPYAALPVLASWGIVLNLVAITLLRMFGIAAPPY